MNTNVWMRKTRKQCKCHYCPKMVLNGEYQIVCQHYMKSGSGKIWWFRRSFHVQCWIDQAVAALEKITVVETRGRKKVAMPDADREKRTSILRRRASVVQRIRMETEDGKDIDKIIHLGELLNKLKEEIEVVGGVPESWK